MSTSKRPQRPARPRGASARSAHNVPDNAKAQGEAARRARRSASEALGSIDAPRKSRPSTMRAKPAKPEKPAQSGKGSIVHAGERFANRVKKKPWQRGRRWLPTTIGTLIALVVLAALAFAFLPQLKVSEVRVMGATYVDESSLERIASAREGQSLAFSDLGALESELAAVPGVKAAKATRHWPNTIRVVVTERTAIAQLESGGSTSLVDAAGAKLPANAADASILPHLVVDPSASNVKATEAALVEITRELPPNLRAALTKATAAAPSGITLEVATEAGPRTVVWGGAEDSELKAQVLAALLSQPGAVIDVSSPEAPTIR
ncbi:FtsQ-type POTRA domain-containing protein [Dermabacter sp. p3-SID358]|uniref:cell division protein FtsQ/DivIB n=1 Tax=Dermabacter sp. p3-SID358 TaxID=2916114 RepID=UPI0021A6C845|nr:FtsQ-type POTRA domain-containing protein [Dermabacter sp. p3-SID358]MCT1867285.1 FtsQ-type POTRA domain-containing protein [Dermabacter sp. p3-SID358]